ncbi:MAG: MerR family DNA-binding transcriptional regulator [Proteobacteria bacterium]|nr:MerR family DNA-binding transcriptional regulator [Pseudomonadota bacterium]
MAPGDSRTYSIRQLCREFGVTARALRFYEDKGLLSPDRRGQTRVFSHSDWARLKLIVQGKQVGFSLVEIRELLDLYDHKDNNAQQLAVSLGKFRAQIETLERQREAVDLAIENLQKSCHWIEKRLKTFRPDLLPNAEDYHASLSAGLDTAGQTHAHAPMQAQPTSIKPLRSRS